MARRTLLGRGHLEAGLSHAQRFENAPAQDLAQARAIGGGNDLAQHVGGIAVAEGAPRFRRQRPGCEPGNEIIRRDIGQARAEIVLERDLALGGFAELGFVGET
jgi:hypothetical protein